MPYTMNIVAEQFFQDAIAASDEGDLVIVAHEVGNPRDDEALVVKHAVTGRTLGYLPMGSFVHRIVFEEEGSVGAQIERIYDAGGVLQVKIRVDINHRDPAPRVRYAAEGRVRQSKRERLLDIVDAEIVQPARHLAPPASLSDLRVAPPEEEKPASQSYWPIVGFVVALMAWIAYGMFF